MKSILQDWVQNLGLRHQGVLLGAMRGCDTAPRHDRSKLFTRAFRGIVLNAHCGDPRKCMSYIEFCGQTELYERFEAFRSDLDHYPHHYVMHVIHAIEVVGHCHPEQWIREVFTDFYWRLCRGLHVTPESRVEMDLRLNADEKTFASAQ